MFSNSLMSLKHHHLFFCIGFWINIARQLSWQHLSLSTRLDFPVGLSLQWLLCLLLANRLKRQASFALLLHAFLAHKSLQILGCKHQRNFHLMLYSFMVCSANKQPRASQIHWAHLSTTLQLKQTICFNYNVLTHDMS